MDPDAHITAHAHSSRHREEILRSALCGCFYCRKTFAPAEIEDWVDWVADERATALCPRCGIDSVIGDASGYPITEFEFLERMHVHWFNTS